MSLLASFSMLCRFKDRATAGYGCFNTCKFLLGYCSHLELVATKMRHGDALKLLLFSRPIWEALQATGFSFFALACPFRRHSASTWPCRLRKRDRVSSGSLCALLALRFSLFCMNHRPCVHTG